MMLVTSNSADDAWRQLAERLREFGHLQESRDQPTKELLHVMVTIEDPRQRVVFARPINPAFAVAEVIWMLAGANDLSFLSFWNPRMNDYSDDGLTCHGAYGFRLGSQPRLTDIIAARLRHSTDKTLVQDQLKMAYEALRFSHHSRQAVLQIWDKAYDMPNPVPRSKDIPCNLVSHLLVRDGRLHWLQVMRSNDLFWGFPYNIIQFTTLLEIIAGWLEVEVGPYVHVSDSLHAYARHWQDLESAETRKQEVPSNEKDLRVGTYSDWEKIFEKIVEFAVHLTAQSAPSDIDLLTRLSSDVPRAYGEWMALLLAEALRKRHYGKEAMEAIKMAGDFWGASWRQWVASRPPQNAISA